MDANETGYHWNRAEEEIQRLRESLEIAADALALASQLAQDEGISCSCRAARKDLRDSRLRYSVQ